MAVALGTALATGLGAIPVGYMRAAGPKWLGIGSGVAAGFMIGASIALFYEGRHDVVETVLGAVVGVVFIAILQFTILRRGEGVQIGQLRGASAAKSLTIIAVMTVHSFTEGVAVGVSFAGERNLGLLIAIAIAVHNIPEGFAISLTMVPSGSSVWEAARWSIFSSLPQPLMAVPAFLGVENIDALLPAGLGFAGGAMLWMVGTQLVPDARETISGGSLFAVGLGAMAAMLALEAALLL